MSSKSDRENRANQLNANNPVYDSSRALGQSYDDDSPPSKRYDAGEALSRHFERLEYEQRMRERDRPVEDGFVAAFVSLKGAKKIIRFQVVSKPFMGNRHGSKAANEDFAEVLVQEVGRQLGLRWKSALAMQALYDDSGRDFFWAGYNYPRGQSNGSDLKENARLWATQGKDAADEVRASLALPLSDALDIENWGLVEKHPDLAWTRFSNGFHRQVQQLIEKNQIIGDSCK